MSGSNFGPSFGKNVLHQGVDPLLTVLGVLPSGQQILVQCFGCLLESRYLGGYFDLGFLL